MDLTKLLLERVSDVVYHLLKFQTAVEFLSQDVIKLTPAFSDTEERKVSKGRLFFLSTTRSKSGTYTEQNARSTNRNLAMFVLDGVRLSQNYKGVPVNFFANIKTDQDEMEDRVLANTPTIKAKPYVKEVHLLLVDQISDSQAAAVRKISSEYPVFIYDGLSSRVRDDVQAARDAFILQDKRKAVSIDQIQNLTGADEPRQRFSEPDTLLAELADTLKKLETGQASTVTWEPFLATVTSAGQFVRLRDRVENGARNIKSNPHNRPYADIVSRFMSKYKLPHVGALLQKMIQLYKSQVE